MSSKQTLSIAALRRAVRPILKKYPVRRTFVFGSMSRGDANAKSDVDLLVEFSKTVSLLTLVGLQDQLCQKLHRPVDVVSHRGLRPRFKKYIADDLKLVYES